MYVAYLSLSGLENKNNLLYFAGTQVGSRRPIWSTQESDAVPLFNHPEIGELPVTWNQFLHVWLILYNANNPRGINFRVAEKPWGPRQRIRVYLVGEESDQNYKDVNQGAYPGILIRIQGWNNAENYVLTK